jgi:HEAT repeat protein
VEAFRASDEQLQLDIARTLGDIGDSQAIPALIDALSQSKGNIRIELVRTLGRIGGNKAVTKLIDLLSIEDKDLLGP